MSRNMIETVMGAVVLAVAVVFLLFAYSSADLRNVQGYEVSARFSRIDGLQPGTDVRISGVKVGSVIGESLDPESFLAVVRMSIDPAIKLPVDTVAVVSSESLLGGKFMSLQPGGDTETIPPGGTIEYTQSTPGFEQLLGQVIYNLQSGSGAGRRSDGSGTPGPSGSGGTAGAPGPAETDGGAAPASGPSAGPSGSSSGVSGTAGPTSHSQ